MKVINSLLFLLGLLFFALPAQAIITDPILYLNFNQTSGNVSNATGSMSWSVPTGVNQSVTAVVNRAYRFSYIGNGTPTGPLHITNATWNSIDNTSFTWVMLASRDTDLGATVNGYFGKGGSLSSNGLLVQSQTSNAGRANIYSGTNESSAGVANSFGGGTEQCIVVTYNLTSSQAISFINQSTSQTANLFTDITGSDPFDLLLAGTSNQTRLNGNLTIDQFAMYNRILSNEEYQTVCANWSAGIEFINFTIPAVIPALPPLLTINATNITSGAALTTFCVSGTGTNTSFVQCTTNGTAYNNLTGTYNLTANATGYNNQTVSDYVFSQNATLQFNLTSTGTVLTPIDAATRSTTSFWTNFLLPLIILLLAIFVLVETLNSHLSWRMSVKNIDLSLIILGLLGVIVVIDILITIVPALLS